MSKSIINSQSATIIFRELFDQKDLSEKNDLVDEIIIRKRLWTVKDPAVIELHVHYSIRNNTKDAFIDLCNGNKAAIGPIIGDVLKICKTIDAKILREMILDLAVNHPS